LARPYDLVVIVAAVFQFYFENLLPTDESWPEGFTIQFEDYRVNIEPRLAGDELFPEDIDRTLATAELRLTPLSRPGGRVAVRVNDRILDRIKATVVKEDVERGEDGSLPEGLKDDFLDAAFDAIDAVFSHARVLSDALFVEGVRREYSLEDGQFYVLSPHTISWFGGEDAADLKPVAMYPGGVNATGSSGAIRSPERGAVNFQRLSASLAAHDAGPPLPESLLVTAQERLTQLFLQEAIVALATACEVASDHYLDRTGRAGERRVKTILSARNQSFAEKRLDRLPQLLSNRSFRNEHPAEFDDVQRLYRTRNNVAHAGDLSYSDAGTTTKVDQKLAYSFLVAARDAVGWLAKL
jgi:hypothetical protein